MTNQTSQKNIYTIVTEDDRVIESGLTLERAESLLCYYLNYDLDVYIGEDIDTSKEPEN